MSLTRLRSLFRNLVHRDRVDQDLDDEVRAVYTLLVDEKIQAGLSPEQARRAATLELGMVESAKQQVRDERAGAYVDAFFKDLRYAARMLRANLGFTSSSCCRSGPASAPTRDFFGRQRGPAANAARARCRPSLPGPCSVTRCP